MSVAGAVGELVVLCVKGKPERVAPRLYAHARMEPETVGNRHATH